MQGMMISGLHKRYGATVVIDRFDLAVEDGELTVLLGPSGCGKTTVLRMIAGFVTPDAGAIRLRGRDLVGRPVHDRNIGIVFQNYALFPHMTVFENVAFGLRRRKVADTVIKQKVGTMLDMVRMDHLATRLPRELSGGQQQRVAIARAAAIDPDLLLLDEPLSNLDAQLRVEIRDEIRRLQKRLGITTVLVTHDQEEAMSVGDRLVVMSHGRIQQVGTPNQVYAAPANRFVAGFIGNSNCLDGAVEPGGLTFLTAKGMPIVVGPMPADCRWIIIRAEAIAFEPEMASAPNSFPVVVENVVYLGSGALFTLRAASGDEFKVHVAAGSQPERLVELSKLTSGSIRIDPHLVRPISE